VNIILFGPPGAGKGTQAQKIVNKFNLYQASTGDLLRNEIKNKSDVGKKIEQIISQGDFVTDDIVNKILKKLGWKAKISLDEGLLQTFNWYINHKSFFNSVSKKLYINRLGLKA